MHRRTHAYIHAFVHAYTLHGSLDKIFQIPKFCSVLIMEHISLSRRFQCCDNNLTATLNTHTHTPMVCFHKTSLLVSNDDKKQQKLKPFLLNIIFTLMFQVYVLIIIRVCACVCVALCVYACVSVHTYINMWCACMHVVRV